MNKELEKEIFNFFNRSLKPVLENIPTDELKCIDWFVNDADQFIELKNKKTA